MNEAIGRFAPTPSGPLHLGSLVGALGSYLSVKSQGGLWKVRIDDIDTGRCQPASTLQILTILEDYGLWFDGPVIYESHRIPQYREALESLGKKNLVYSCHCSRKRIREIATIGPEGPIYPGTCKHVAFDLTESGFSTRIKTTSAPITWTDQLQGIQRSSLQQDYGDFVVWRADNIPSYHIATVVDESLDGITEVVRGTDLFSSTFRQAYLSEQLGFKRSRYLHLPLVLQENGKKLSKQTGAPGLPVGKAREKLFEGMGILGLSPPHFSEFDSASSLLSWAVRHWKVAQLPH